MASRERHRTDWTERGHFERAAAADRLRGERARALIAAGARGPTSAPLQSLAQQRKQMIADHLGRLGSALAIVDLAGARSFAAGYSQFFLLAASGIMVRDGRNIVSVLWYKDLGEITLIDKRKQGKPGLWQKLVEGNSGDKPESSLQIYRSNGTQFISIGPQVDERAKRIIYNFLLSKKDQAQP